MASTVHIDSEAAMERLGRAIGPQLRAGDVLALTGPLGAGKTVLARAMVRAACRDAALDVPSPTFTLVQVYDTPHGPLHHFDLYRLDNPDDILDLGWEEAASGISIIEWPDKAGAYLPAKAIGIAIAAQGDTRDVTITGREFAL